MEEKYARKWNFIVSTVYVLLIGLIAYVCFKYVIDLISPFIFAFLIAYLLKRPAKKISAALKAPPKLVSFLLVLFFYSTVGILVALLGLKLTSMVVNLISTMPAIFENQLGPFLSDTFSGIEKAVYRLDPALVDAMNQGFDQFLSTLGENITRISLSLVASLTGIASSLPAFLIRILLMVISTFFIAMDIDMITDFVLRQFSETGRDMLHRIKNYMLNTLLVVIRSYALIMSITFVELSIGLSLIGISNALLIALITAMFDILPVLGTGGIMVPWVIITAFQGHYQTAFGLLAVYVFVTIMRNILEPKIVGGQLGLHPVVTLTSMFVGANLIGIAGLFGFPITLSLLKHLSDTGAIKLFK